MSYRCYQCQSTDSLSIRKRTRNYEPIFICGPCRHSQYVIYKSKQEYKVVKSPLHYISDKDKWTAVAMDSYQRISKKWSN